jgi:hypothetical protein
MRDKEIVGLWEAYLQVHQPKEEVEQLDEFLGSGAQKFVDDATKKVQSGLKGLGFKVNEKPKPTINKENQRNTINQNVPLKNSFDPFDTILEYLVAEGYADTNESALAIMANMSEEWRESIVEGGTGAFVPSRVDDFNNRRDMLKNRYGQDVSPRIPGPSGGGQGGTTPTTGVLKLARGTSSSNRGVESKNNA